MVSEIRQGEVYWLDVGAAAGSAPASRRPCVIVQSDVFNRSRIATTAVCAITSNLHRAAAPGNVSLEKGEAGLPKACVVNVSQISTVGKSELVERIGKLPGAKVRQILAGLQLVFEGL